ncbi:MAG: AmmeMemoRadiSam system radical SAM enzyme [Desulfobacteraceae bacterium 4572_123]|nr:MAG: AmmeMemoRadiSam system radical SAM enzyme [Desulfobacteraceae bacterium 4572_123]
MEAYLYKPLQNKAVQCNLCHHRCVITDGKRGICNVRENRSGTLETMVYGKVIAGHIDPVEKKPIYHMMPGSRSYSIATVGCNFKCRFCQNADIAQMPADRSGLVMGEKFSPRNIVSRAVESHCRSIAYTYTEPTIFFEYALEIAGLAHAKGLRNIFVTNGYMTPEAIEMATGLIDAANVDLKAFSDKFYKKYCSARLAPVLETLKHMRSAGIWIEVTTLLIPGLNDDKHEIASLAEFIADSLGRETPWHISRFHPAYRLLDAPLTPVKSLTTAFEIGKDAGLKYVYIGNVATKHGADTFCSNCGTTVIDRKGYTARCNMTRDERCPVCNEKIQGVELSF